MILAHIAGIPVEETLPQAAAAASGAATVALGLVVARLGGVRRKRRRSRRRLHAKPRQFADTILDVPAADTGLAPQGPRIQLELRTPD
jgi:hypothetical protein